MNSDTAITVTAAVLHAPHTALRLETLQVTDVRDDEVLVKLVATGICHTDLSFMGRDFLADKPMVLGHEGAGYVAALGQAVTGLEVGDPVVLTFDSCGHCPSCDAAMPAYCHDFIAHNFLGQRADGSTALKGESGPVRHAFFGQSSFATHSVCKARNVIKLESDAELELMGPLGCGLQTGAGAVLNVLKPQAHDALVIFGTGSVGLAGVMAAKATGVQTIIAVDAMQSRLEAAQNLGASHVIHAVAGLDLVAQIKRICGTGATHSLDTTANMTVLRQAIDCLAPRGVCGFLGGAAVGSELIVNVRDVMIGGKTIRGIVEGDSQPAELIPRLIAMYRAGQFPMDKIARFYPFADIAKAITDSESGAAIKAILRMPD